MRYLIFKYMYVCVCVFVCVCVCVYVCLCTYTCDICAIFLMRCKPKDAITNKDMENVTFDNGAKGDIFNT